MDQPFFSIVIPSFNAADLISKALDSAINQTFPDFEIIVMDGGSTDSTLEIVNSRKDNRIRVISQKDKGIYDAMNKGITLSNAKWIYFLGADDTLYDERVLKNVYRVATETNADVIYGNVLSERFHGIYDGKFTVEKLYEQNICHQAIFIRRDVFIKVGDFDLRYKRHADWDHNIRWFLNPQLQVKFMDETIAEYADGGYSSVGIDEQFVHDKPKRFLRYGRSSLKPEFKRNLYISMALQKKNEHRYIAYFLLKFRILTLK